MITKLLAKNHALGKWLLLLTLTLIYGPELATAQKEADVKWGGLWLRGSNADRNKFFPVGGKFAFNPDVDLAPQEIERSADFGKALLALMRNEAKPAGGRIVDRLMPDNELAKIGAGRALVMACAINYEFFETTVDGGERVIFAEIGFDLLMCNFRDRSVVFCLPARLQFKDLAVGKEQAALKREAAEALEKIYLRLPEKFLELSKTPWDGGLAFQTVGFGKIDVWDEAKKRMHEEFAARPEFLISQLFAGTFSEAIQLPATPYSIHKNGEAVYHGLEGNIADNKPAWHKNGASFMLGRPDYVVDLIVPKFHEAEGKGKAQGRALHFALARVTLKSAAGKVLYNKKSEACVNRIMANGGKVRPLWLASWDASNLLFKNAAQDLKRDCNRNGDLKIMVQECTLPRPRPR